ncbi:MAG TPA: LutB/LldF family L-lactate oxidation iron-sulfur protein [Bryobacterales bacterium]|nr:LutB/LldF family L-lactate oxidation iron-sulfur protein [Bryobacterales bacterium]
MSAAFHQRIHEALLDERLQKALYAATGRLMQERKHGVAPDKLPDYQELRAHANCIKQHTLENLDYYLELLASKVEERGGHAVWCRDAGEAQTFIGQLAQERGVRLAVKSKSMTSEEVELNEALRNYGVEAVETDLGEFIIQLAHQRPYHIVAPAMHKTKEQVADLFAEKLGVPREEEISKQTMIARAILRRKFLEAGMGISGANFLVAESGAVVIVENEGNARLTTSAPRIHVALAGIEKIIPRAADLAVFLQLLGRSATGQPLTSYTSFLSGPRRAGEIDGPEEFYLVLIDNGRSRILADGEKRQTLYCIRCGACLNICPVYRRIGGYSYPGAYSGPIGAILTPQALGLGLEPELPFASSLCGACAEVCPVKIDIPKMLLALRGEVKKIQAREVSRWSLEASNLEKLGFGLWAWLMRHPRLFEMAGTAAQALLPADRSSNPGGKWIRSLPGPLRAWTRWRDFPPPAPKSFRQLWRERRRPS